MQVNRIDKKARNLKMPDVPPKRTKELSEEEVRMQAKMLNIAKKFSKDPEMAICKKLGIGACFEF